MKRRHHLLIALAISMLTAAAAFGQTETTPQYLLYGLQSLAPGQSLRVTAQNPRYSDSEIIPCIRVRVVFEVYEHSLTEAGKLRLARRAAREYLLDAGEGFNLDFPAPRAGELVSASIFFRLETRDYPPDARLRPAFTASVRESGRTLLNLPAVSKGFDPQPDPPSEF